MSHKFALALCICEILWVVKTTASHETVACPLGILISMICQQLQSLRVNNDQIYPIMNWSVQNTDFNSREGSAIQHPCLRGWSAFVVFQSLGSYLSD